MPLTGKGRMGAVARLDGGDEGPRRECGDDSTGECPGWETGLEGAWCATTASNVARRMRVESAPSA
jgi:hypothetical protein